MIASIGIVDDHPAVLIGVREILDREFDLKVVAMAASVHGLLQSADRFDLVLLDLVLRDGSTPSHNIAALKELGIPVLVYTSGERLQLVREASRADVAGVIRKTDPPRAIVAAVRQVLSGMTVESADWAAAIESDDAFMNAQLSDREAEVLALYASGETAERVAALLFISRETVIDHVRRIRAKYAAVERSAPTKVDLFRRAVEDGIVPDA